MNRNWAISADASEDGHPCEAALEFRRVAIRCGAADEVPVDALDLAVAYAWIGKVVSRTADVGSWVLAGADPNTWQMIRAMALDAEVRKAALASAKSGSPSAIFGESHLKKLRATKGFHIAFEQVSKTVAHTVHPADVERIAVLSSIARALPGAQLKRVPGSQGNLIMLEAYRSRKR